jgi:hypothetical protein
MVVAGALRPLGGMDKDSELLDVRNGDYINAVNIRHTSNNGGTTNSTENVLGNEKVFDLGSVVQRNETNRIYINSLPLDPPAPYNIDLDFFDQNLTATASTSTAAVVSDIVATLAAVRASILAAFPNATVTTTVDASPTFGHLDVTMNDYVGQRFNVSGTAVVRTVVDAVDKSNVGKLKVIGSYDLLGDLFIFSTTNEKESTSFNITGCTNTAPLVVTVTNHGLQSGDEVAITGVGGATGANGSWIVAVTGVNTFSLVGSSSTGAYTGGGTLFKNTQGLAEIGVAKKNEEQVWTYTRLIRSRELNFSTLHQMDVRCEADGVKKSIYFTDNYNQPKVMYYYGSYVTNGFLIADYPKGIYELNSVATESILGVGSPNVVLGVTQTTGGTILCGNWRYAVRFGFEGGAFGEWSALTNPINVYLNDNPSFITGGEANQKSNKLNIIQVTNVPQGLYTRVELAAIQYVGDSFMGYVVLNQTINPIQTSIQLIHNGSEVGFNLDLTTLGQLFTTIKKAQNLELIDNRLSLSNVEVVIDKDLNAWAQTIWYYIRSEELLSMGAITTTPEIRVEEYYKAQNVIDKTGYMINETYRCGVQVKWKNAGWSKTYFVADVTIDTTGINGQRRGSTLVEYLGSSLSNFIYVPYIEWTNVDLDYVLSDGTALRDNIEQIRFVRQKCVPEVLATGLLVISKSSSPTDVGQENEAPFTAPLPTTPVAPDRTKCKFISPDIYMLGAYPSTSGIVFRSYGAPAHLSSFTFTETGIAPTGAGTTTFDINVDVSEYSGYTDIVGYTDFFPVNSITNETAFSQDMVSVDFGVSIVNTNGVPDFGVYYAQIFRAQPNKYGATNTGLYETTGCQSVDIENITTSTIFNMFGGDAFVQKQYKRIANVASSGAGIPPVITLQFYVAGFYSQNRVNSQMQINVEESDRTLPGKKGTRTLGAVWFVNAGVEDGEPLFPSLLASPPTFPNVTNSYNSGYTPSNNLQSYITFDSTQTQIEKLPQRIYWSEIKAINSLADQYRVILPLNFVDLEPMFGAITDMKAINKELFTWQQRSFMRQYFNSRGTLSSSDNSSILIGDGSVLSRGGDELSVYGTNHKWSVVKGVSPGGKDTVYWINSEHKKLIRFGADGTVVMSDVKGMQSWFANNLKYAMNDVTPANNLGIHGVYDNRFQEALFTVRCAIDPDNTIQLVNGDIMDVDKFYYNTEVDFNGFYTYYKPKSFFTLSSDKMPESGADWEQYFDKITTSDNRAYNVYTIVLNEYRNKFTTYYSFTPKIYLNYSNGFLSQHPTETAVYEHNRGEICEWYKETLSGVGTIAYTADSDQIVGGGTNFLTQFQNPNEISYQLIIDGVEYEVDSVQSDTILTLKEVCAVSGTLTSYDYTRSLSKDGFVEMICNEQPNIVKMWNANRFNSEIAPNRIEYATQTQVSYLEETDFEVVEGQFDAPIKNDSTVSAENPLGVNEEDTSRLFGKYVKVKMFFEKRRYQKLYDAFIKFVPNSRMYNK